MVWVAWRPSPFSGQSGGLYDLFSEVFRTGVSFPWVLDFPTGNCAVFFPFFSLWGLLKKGTHSEYT
jgi:hypothetical protein